MAHAARLIDITPDIKIAYLNAISAICQAREAEGTVTSDGVLTAFQIGLHEHMTRVFVNSDHCDTWKERARETMDFVEDVANECRSIAYRTAPLNGRLAQQGHRLLRVHEALQALSVALRNATETEQAGTCDEL